MICIYCGQADRTRFRGVEHVIPQAFGRFGTETPTLDCVCDDRNAYFGRELDLLLARETPEGLGRCSRGQLSSETRPQRRVTLTLADPAEAGAFHGMKVAVDGATGQLMPPSVQFHFHNFRTGEGEVYFLHQIAALVLPEDDYGKPGSDGQPGTWRCRILAPSRDAHDAMVEALRETGIGFQSGRPFKPRGKAMQRGPAPSWWKSKQ